MSNMKWQLLGKLIVACLGEKLLKCRSFSKVVIHACLALISPFFSFKTGPRPSFPFQSQIQFLVGFFKPAALFKIDNKVVYVFVCDLLSCLEMHKICFVSGMIDGQHKPFPQTSNKLTPGIRPSYQDNMENQRIPIAYCQGQWIHHKTWLGATRLLQFISIIYR